MSGVCVPWRAQKYTSRVTPPCTRLQFNWYTKRAILAAVYKATELRLLTDRSENFSETWAFLDSRLEDAVSAGRCVRQLREAAPQAGHTAGVILNTVRGGGVCVAGC